MHVPFMGVSTSVQGLSARLRLSKVKVEIVWVFMSVCVGISMGLVYFILGE